MPEATEAEPSMDEILASIRRIIADDGGVKAPAEEAPLLLTERVDPIPSETEKPMTDELEPHAEAAPDNAPDTEWIGEAAAVQASSAFDKLAALEPTPAEPIAMPPPGRSLEDLTRDMLRPMLKEWLDENLPRIVQDRVDEEVERLARRRVR
jgi:cell pole-organizing protein PopZ